MLAGFMAMLAGWVALLCKLAGRLCMQNMQSSWLAVLVTLSSWLYCLRWLCWLVSWLSMLSQWMAMLVGYYI
jgi:hypothetical protein